MIGWFSLEFTPQLPYFLYTNGAEAQRRTQFVTLYSQLDACRREKSGGKTFLHRSHKCLGQPVAQFGEMRQLRAQLARELALIETPAPVPHVLAGSVHAGFTAQTQDVLQRNDT